MTDISQKFELIQTEKSYLTQSNNTYLLRFFEKSFSPNKIEVKKMLIKQGLNPLKVTILNTYSKKKRRGKKSKIVSALSYKKYYVRLEDGQKLESTQN